jgi:hypothetical protein
VPADWLAPTNQRIAADQADRWHHHRQDQGIDTDGHRPCHLAGCKPFDETTGSISIARNGRPGLSAAARLN